MKIKIIIRYHYALTRMTKIYKSDHTKCFQGIEQRALSDIVGYTE